MPLRCSKSAATVRTIVAIAPAANTLRSSAEAGAAVRLAKEVTMSNCRNGKDSKRTVFLLKSEEAQRGTKKYEEVRTWLGLYDAYLPRLIRPYKRRTACNVASRFD